MTHEAGIWIFGIIALVCVSVWLLCRRSKSVEDSVDAIMADVLENSLSQSNIAPFHYNLYSDELAREDRNIRCRTKLDTDMMIKQIKSHMADMDAMKPLPKGWQGWEGGECPVPDDTDVVVMKRSGRIWTALSADCLRWYHYGDDNDIVAWRVA